ncbi:glycosyltransferase [Flavobacteriaceae bacterium]|nr:glycosyltransferase [Flavobacteriaceae bacterium]
MTFSIVIPTKNRPKELATVFDSLLAQTRLPDQIIIIDQSSPDKVIKDQLTILAEKANVTLNYIHDESITGLVQAKAASIQYNYCDYISFFDDDIVHEPDYLAVIEQALTAYPEMIGVNGVILNAPEEGFLKRLIFQLTHFGLYKDNRQRVIRSLNVKKVEPQAVDALSGGLSTWHKDVFKTVVFDTENKFHAYEDKEFSIRIERAFPEQMFIVPSAKLYHYHAAGNRQSLLRRTENDVVEVWMLFKKNGNFNYLGLDFVVLLFGLFFNALLLSLKLFNLNFLWNYFKGFKAGRKKQIIKT